MGVGVFQASPVVQASLSRSSTMTKTKVSSSMGASRCRFTAVRRPFFFVEPHGRQASAGWRKVSRTHSTHSGSVVMVTMSPWGSQYCHRRLGHPHHCPTTLCSSARVYVPLTRRISTPDSFCSANLMEQSICADDGCGTLDEKYEK